MEIKSCKDLYKFLKEKKLLDYWIDMTKVPLFFKNFEINDNGNMSIGHNPFKHSTVYFNKELQNYFWTYETNCLRFGYKHKLKDRKNGLSEIFNKNYRFFTTKEELDEETKKFIECNVDLRIKRKKQRVKDIKKDIKGYNDSIIRAKNDIDVITKEIEELKERKTI